MIDLTDEQTIQKINRKLGDFIIKYRETHNLTADEFTAMAGLGRKYFYQIDSNGSINTIRPYPRDIRISTFIKIARLLDMTVDDFLQYLLYEKDKKN
jgi:hypothetical protein